MIYHIHLNGEKFVVNCDDFKLENGQTIFYNGGAICHIAPKEALIISNSEGLKAIEILRNMKRNIGYKLSDAKKNQEKNQNEESKPRWNYEVVLLENFIKEHFDDYNSPARALLREVYGDNGWL